MPRKYSFDLQIAIELLGGAPDQNEIKRLTQYYPTFEWNHRSGLLWGFFEGKKYSELVDEKLSIKGISLPINKQSRGAHTSWAVNKTKKYVIRMLYLRYRLDLGMNQIKANATIFKKVPLDSKAKDAGQSSIRKATHCAKLGDKEIEKA